MSSQSKAQSQQHRNNKKAERSRRPGGAGRGARPVSAPVVSTVDEQDTVENRVVVARRPMWLVGLLTVMALVVSVVGFVAVGGVFGVILGAVFALLTIVGGLITYLLLNAESVVTNLAGKRSELETSLGRRTGS